MYKETDQRPEIFFFSFWDVIVKSGQIIGNLIIYLYTQQCIGYKSSNQNDTASKAEEQSYPGI